jgi:hypothetical protein
MKTQSSFEEKTNVVINAKRRFSLDDNLLPSHIPDQLEQNIQSQSSLNSNNVGSSCKKKALIGGLSAFIGLGVGMAMMPIFNEEVEHLDRYGIDVHENSSLFTISTLNTLFLMSSYAAFFLYKFFSHSDNEEHELTEFQTKSLVACKALAGAASIAPLVMLWNIEFDNQEVEGTSGFDQFMAWAAISSIPLIIFKALGNYEETSEFVKHELVNAHELNSLGSKIAVYGIDSIALVARCITYMHLTNELLENIGLHKEASLALSIITSGVISNAVVAVNEHSKLKKLFLPHKEHIGAKEVALGVFSAAEGCWFALPLVSAGLEATDGWNPLLRGGLFVPMFISHANLEANGIFNALMPTHTHHEQEELQMSLLGDGSEDLSQNQELV